jgi:7-carboxy-7-deazaguanine synthase
LNKLEKIPVVEIFNSISGEGISTGILTSFVRVAGCNLRCSYCDTVYSYSENEESIRWMTPAEIADELRALDCRHVICTGGEPMESGKVKRHLPAYLASEGFEVRIETNGSCHVYSYEELEAYGGNKLRSNLWYTLDVKCPGSGMDHLDKLGDNVDRLTEGDEIKFVVGDDDDFDYAMLLIERHEKPLSERKIVLCFSPVFGRMEPRRLVDLMKAQGKRFMEGGLKVRFSLQVHKVVWAADAKGV